MNFVAYFFGVLAAFIYDHISTNQIKIGKYLPFRIFFYSLLPLGILWLFSGHTFFQLYNDEDMRFWISVFAAVQRNVWGFGIACLIVGMSANMVCKYKPF